MRRTPEELNAIDAARIAKRRLMLARAKDPRIELLEETVRLIERCREHVDFSEHTPGDLVSKILETRDRLVDEAVRP